MTVHLIVHGPIDGARVRALCDRLRAALDGIDADVVDVDVGDLVEPDLGTVDALARVRLTAHRLGCQVRLHDASAELRELLAMSGLAEVVPCDAESGLDARRQAERGEEARSVEEERDPDDATR